MDPISANAMPPATFSDTAQIPAPPDASDVREFQNIYNQDGSGIEANGMDPNKQITFNMTGSMDRAGVNSTAFQTAMQRMVEVHEKSVLKIETLLDRVASSASLTPADLLEIQVSLTDATTGLATYQSFDKKTDEGVKALMTGQ